MSIDRIEAARHLAQTHYDIEPGLAHIVLYSACQGADTGSDEPLKLLEVNQNTMASGIMPLHFGPIPERGIRCASVIIEVTPDEYRRIQTQELALPAGWDQPQDLPKVALNGGAA